MPMNMELGCPMSTTNSINFTVFIPRPVSLPIFQILFNSSIVHNVNQAKVLANYP